MTLQKSDKADEGSRMLQGSKDVVKRMEYRSFQPSSAKTAGDGVERLDVRPFMAGGQDKLGAAQLRIQELEVALAELEQSQAERLEGAAQRGREDARRDAVAREKEASGKLLRQLSVQLTDFRREQDHYFARVEQEVVRLALAITARILHREAQLDPLLLSGAVRVALGQLADSTEVQLRVPESEFVLWEEMLRLMPNLPLRPRVSGDANLSAGECLLETNVGSVDLGVRAQLVEIERGFFDLLDQRPQSSSQTESCPQSGSMGLRD